MSERSIFLSALELTDPAVREAFLADACRENPQLRTEVDALLQAHETDREFLETPAVQQAATSGSSTATTKPRADGQRAQSDDPTRLYGASAEETPDEDRLEFLEPSDQPGVLGRLGHYEVRQTLGRGGFGIVLQAFDDKLHRMVAIKVMAPELAATSPARKRFLREARNSASIRHENIVHIHAVEEQPIPYLVMEYVPGQTLQQRLDQHGPLNVTDVLHIGLQIAEGLAAAHAQGLIHRDIKPANILLESGIVEKVRITDFGLARTSDDASLTQSGVIAGTPMFMAPEQARGEGIDPRTDLFSLGSVLYTMVSGRPPFRAANTVAVLKRVCEDTPRPIQEIIPEAPVWLCGIIAKLQAKEPEDRFQSAREVADLLHQCLQQLQQTGMVKDIPGLPIPATATPAPAPRAADWRLVRRWLALVALALVVMSSVTFVRYWRSARPGQIFFQFEDPALVVRVKGPNYAVTSKPGVDPELKSPLPGFYTWSVYRGDRLIHEDHFSLKSGEVKHVVVPAKPTIGDEPSVAANTAPEPPIGSPGEWQSIFNGRDLTGWTTHPDEPSDWKVLDGALVGSGRPGYLFTERNDYRDFHLRCEVRINQGGDGGVIVRAPFEPAGMDGLPGYEVQIQAGQPLMQGWTTGALGASEHTTGWRILEPANSTQVADSWMPLEVIARGHHLETHLAGQAVVEFRDPKQLFQRGRIALQLSGPQTKVEFRNMELRELRDEPNQAAQLASLNRINFSGQWKSNWGIVHFTQSPVFTESTPAGATQGHTAPFIKVEGTFYEGRGVITGTVEGASRTMYGLFAEAGGPRGVIQLKIADDNQTITGTYGYRNATQTDPITKYDWLMSRDSAIPEPAIPDIPGAGPWVNLLQLADFRELADKARGVRVEGEQVTLSSSEMTDSIELWSSQFQGQDVQMRLKIQSLERKQGYHFGVGWTHETGNPKRCNGVIIQPDTGKPLSSIWQFDDKYAVTGLSDMRVDPNWNEPLDCLLELRNGRMRWQIGNAYQEAQNALDPERTVTPHIAVARSNWRILEWQARTLPRTE